MLNASGIDGVPGGEVVAAVQHDVRQRYLAFQQSDIGAQWQGPDDDPGIQGRHSSAHRIGFTLPDPIGGVSNLTLQVGEVNHVIVCHCEVAYARRTQVQGHW